jgi:nucleoside-diphosphate-sugar epimerase
MESDFKGPVNIGSEEMVSINELAQMAIDISGKDLKIKNIQGEEFVTKYGFTCPLGVRGRNSDNKLYEEKIGWAVSQPLRIGMEKTFDWVNEQVQEEKKTYIYESPDGGETVYRREFGAPHETRELVK